MNYNGFDIDVVWVDLDDTLIDFTTNAHTALVGMWNDEPLLQRLFAAPDVWAECYEHHNLALWAEYNVGNITRNYLRMERFRRPLVEAGMNDADAREVSVRFDPLYLDYLAMGKALMPGAIELLEALRKSGVKIGVLSNGFKEVQFRKIRNTGLDPYIDIVVLSDDIEVNKPDIRIYNYAMMRSECEDCSRHLMVGDNPDTDIKGAVNAGWHAIWYHPERCTDSTTCPDGAIEIRNLREVFDLIG